MSIHSIILAAGQGTRMKSRRPKVLQPLAARPLLAHVLDAARGVSESIHVVYGHGGDEVRQQFAEEDVTWVEQSEQLGTGHAVQQAVPAIDDAATVLVLYGDVPLIAEATLRRLIDSVTSSPTSDRMALLTVELDDPHGYGRIIRADNGGVAAIVEEKDATDQQRSITEANTGILCVPAKPLKLWLSALRNDNSQGEYYLTDVIEIATANGFVVEAIRAVDADEVLGVNDRLQLAHVERCYQRRVSAELARQGLHLLDPDRFDLRGNIEFGRDVEIDVNVVLEGRVVLADGVRIGAGCVLRDVSIGSDSIIHPFSVLDDCVVGDDCQVGPFARLRPGTRLEQAAKVGNFVETKKAIVGIGSKINHLSYIGDAIIGQNVNVGAGVITCNYDGVNKHQTLIDDDAFIGSDSQLVAPVRVGKGATVGAGTTLTRDAPAEALTVSRAKQSTHSGWKRPVKTPANKSNKKGEK